MKQKLIDFKSKVEGVLSQDLIKELDELITIGSSLDALISDHVENLDNNFDTLNLKENEKKLIAHALKNNRGKSKSEIASILGISRTSLYNKIEEYELEFEK